MSLKYSSIKLLVYINISFSICTQSLSIIYIFIVSGFQVHLKSKKYIKSLITEHTYIKDILA